MLTLFLAFLVQEPLSSSFALSRVYNADINLVWVHLTYFLATSLDIVIGFLIGSHIKKHSENKKAYLYLKKKLEYLFPEAASGRRKDVTLFLLGPLIFPVTAFLTPFINLSLVRSYFILLISEFLFWYSAVWGIVLGFNDERGLRLIHVALITPLVVIGLYKIYSRRKLV